MIEPSPVHVTGAAALIALLLALIVALLVVRLRRRSSERAYVAEIDDRRERLKLALWATGERYWDYDVASGQLRRLLDDAAGVAGFVFSPARVVRIWVSIRS